MNSLQISLCEEEALVPVGTIETDRIGSPVFRYLSEYVDDSAAISLSQSLPLSSNTYDEAQLRPYFEGLLAEGSAREALAAELHVRETNYLAILARCGHDCIGDVVIEDGNDRNSQTANEYEAVNDEQLIRYFKSLPDMTRENIGSRLSLAGAQSKIGLARMPGNGPMSRGWLKPHRLAASTHILKTCPIEKLIGLEFLCMKAAKECGIEVPEVALLDFGRPVLAVERFDRNVTVLQSELHVARLHQEDFAQAFGITSASKYAELQGGSIAAIARWIRARASKPAEDLSQFAKVVCFNYLIGNCDAHLKNFSIVYHNGRKGAVYSLSPAYSLVSTSFFDRFGKDMAMAIGDARDIRDVLPNDFALLAGNLGITANYLKSIAAPIVGTIGTAIHKAGDETLCPSQELIPYLANDLQEDIAPRLSILEEFCES